MGFGAEYEGMSDREILIELAGDMKAARFTVQTLSTSVALHSTTLTNHENRIALTEQLHACQTKVKDDKLIIYGLVISAVAGWGALVVTMAQLFAHGG